MRRRRKSSIAAASWLGLGLALACGEDGDGSHRHLAADWCADIVDLQDECEGRPADPGFRDERRQTCELDPAWDWTDACGDRYWAYLECLGGLTCDEYARARDEADDTDPCQALEDAFYGGDCPYLQPGTNMPVDHTGG